MKITPPSNIVLTLYETNEKIICPVNTTLFREYGGNSHVYFGSVHLVANESIDDIMAMLEPKPLTK